MASSDRDEIDALLPLQHAEFHILLALSGGDCHGYGIIQDVEARTNGALRLSPGRCIARFSGCSSRAWWKSRESRRARSARAIRDAATTASRRSAPPSRERKRSA